MAVVTSDFLQALFTNYRVIWEQAFLAAETAIDYERFCTVTQSQTATESYDWLGTVPQMQKWIDERQLSGLNAYNYSLTNEHYEVTIEVDRNTIEDDKYHLIQPRIVQLGQEAARFPAKVASQTLAQGASMPCYDGSNFFATTHVVAGQSAQSNLITSTGTALANVRADFVTSRTAMRRFKDEAGRPMNLKPDLILIPPDLEDVFDQMLHTDQIALTTGTQMTNVLKGAADVMVDANLTDLNPSGHSDDWYLLCTNEPVKPLIAQWRKQPEFVALDAPDSEAVFMRRRYAYGVDSRFAIGYGLWFMACQVAS